MDSASSDTVNLSSDLSGVAGGTAATQFTASLAKILQGATAVDPATGLREINAGVGQALGSQLGQLLTQSGYSQSDANAASDSLVTQLAASSQGSKGFAISLTNSSNVAGSYSGALSGGVEESNWSAQTTTALSISLNPSSGNLTVKLDNHRIGATNIGWGSATAGNVSIAFTPAELQGYGAYGETSSSPAGSAIQESETTTNGPPPSFTDIGSLNDEAPTSGTGSNNQALANLNFLRADQALLPGIIAANAASAASSNSLDGAGTVTAPKTAGETAKDTAAQQALTTLQAVLKQLHDAATASSVSLQATTNVGTLLSNSDGTKSLTYTRPSGDLGLVNLPGVNVNA